MTSLPAAVLWDLDGTLIDTEPYWIACEYELVAQFGGTWTDDDAHSIVGFDLLDAAEIIRDRGGVRLEPQEIVERLLAGVRERIRAHMPWRPGAAELLAALNRTGVPTALVTMSWRAITEEVLRQLPAGSFQAVITGDMVENGKPHPEPYQRAAQELGVDPLSCVAIEDSPTGVRSAEAAGCVVVGVPNVVAIPAAPGRTLLDSLVGVTPEQLGDIVESTPPPLQDPTRPPRPPRPIAPSRDGRPPRVARERSREREQDAAAGSSRGVDVRAWMRGNGFFADRMRVLIAAAVALVLVLAGVWWFLLRGDDDKISYEPGPFNVHTWVFPSQLDRTIPGINTRASAFHQVSPFWFETTGATSIGEIDDPGYDPEEGRQFIANAKAAGVPLVASILDSSGKGTMAAILADATQRQAHIDTIVTFATSNGFEGIDLDYENFAFTDGSDTWETTRPNWVTFIQELSERFDAEGLILTVSVPPNFGDAAVDGDHDYWVYDYESIAPYVDAIRVMAYDYSILSGEPGPIAPIDWVERVIDGATELVGSPEKLVLGIPLYAYNWVTATTGTCPENAEGPISQTSWRVAELLTQRNPTPPVFDPTTGETSFTYQLEQTDGTTTCTQTRHVQYLDDQGIRLRMQMSVDKGMLGVALFAYGYEPNSIWQQIDTINAALTPPSTTTPG
ncbi:HAD-IA family hydrolase [Desertimonas flava]|uniref:HAD-IA family hydrolase n=1 Tax=Desertimonas flava TaxID=2064846 RepID=UPI000E347991|nr:HAD-IA family hydrolase [Desertimonas flava]